MWISVKYLLDGVAPSLTQGCLASTQPCSNATRNTAWRSAIIAASPAPSDEPAITVSDHLGVGSGPLRFSTNFDHPSPGEVVAKCTSSLPSRFSMLFASSTFTTLDLSSPLRISSRRSCAQVGDPG